MFGIVPPGEFENEFQHVKHLLRMRPKRPPGIVSAAPEVLYLLGQARFAARVEAVDYRDVLERAYPDRQSQALVSNAVFSIPYVEDPPSAFSHARGEPGTIRFLTHLRARRTVYAKNPAQAEGLIITRLKEISSDLDGETTIEAGLGWADFIVSGVVHPSKFGAFLKCLVEFNRAKIESAVGGSECVFKRSLTLLGYQWTGDHQPPVIEEHLNALMFIRARPGRLAEVEQQVIDTFPGAEVAFVDGKIDVIARITGSRPDFFKGHEDLSEGAGQHIIEKFETHVIFGHSMFESADESPSTVPDGESGGCQCGTVKHPPYDLGEPGDHDLPPSLTNAIKNLDFLFSSTMRDHANCCDARTAVLACEESLKRLLMADMVQKVAGREEKNDNAAALRQDAAVHLRQLRIDRWVRTSERILRQRTVGSFEEFLGQSDRAVAYRGGAQKVLTVADNLMNDMYARLLGSEQPQAYLTSLYDSVDRIQHVVGTGLVRMPVRALFFLPGVVPDLWHEVGGFHYFRTLDFTDIGLDLNDPVQIDLHQDLADHFGDLVSFLYGFRLDLDQFGTALIDGWLASQAYKDVPLFARRASYVQIVARIVAVAQFRYEAKRRVSGQRPLSGASRKAALSTLYDEVIGIAVLHPGDLPPATPALRESVIELLTTSLMISGLQELRSRLRKNDVNAAVKALTSAPASVSFTFETSAALRSFDPDTDLNEQFRNLFWAVTLEKRRTGFAPNAFAQSAALIRGAALEYHRRATLHASVSPDDPTVPRRARASTSLPAPSQPASSGPPASS